MSILIIDYGGPTVYKIYETLADLETTTILIKPDHESLPEDIKGIILSGGPDHLYDENSRKLPKWIDQVKVPILGICYGMQLIGHHFHCKVIKQLEIEHGYTLIRSIEKDILLGDFSEDIVWMNHYDTIVDIPPDLTVTSISQNGYVASINYKKWWGVQMHPENINNTLIFKNFIKICG